MRIFSTTDPADLVRKEIKEIVNLVPMHIIGEDSPFAVRWHFHHMIMALSQDPQNRSSFRFLRFDRDQTFMPEAIHMNMPEDLDMLQLCLRTVGFADAWDGFITKKGRSWVERTLRLTDEHLKPFTGI